MKQRGHTVCQNVRKWEDYGPGTSGFQGSGLHEFRYPNNNIYKLAKSVQRIRISGFGIHTTQLPKGEKESGTHPLGFRGS
jgi:hypothetical protein